MNENESYIFGLLMTDGCLELRERNRGKISLEISYNDRDIIDKLIKIVPKSMITERTRQTNFKKQYHSITFNNFELSFRTFLIENGFPTTDKTNNATIPINDYSEIDFWRGVIDGDGSLGITKDNRPFISLTTKSEQLKNFYCDFLYRRFDITKNVKRNKRDNIYNILVFGRKAIEIAKLLYISSKSELYIKRKYQKAMEMLNVVK